MGLRSKKTIEVKKQEAQHKRESEANAFDKAFIDKTYTVAKKVLDNVEKVADYDYDALFDRVNKAIDNKLPKSTKSVSSKEREYRSKEFDKKVSTHKERFSIDDYLSKQANYKNSILEKTKKNIQKKYSEAEEKNKSVKTSDATGIQLDSYLHDHVNKVDTVIVEPIKADETASTKGSSIENNDDIINKTEIDNKKIQSKINKTTEENINFTKNQDKINAETVEADKNIFTLVDKMLIKTTDTLDDAITNTSKTIDDSIVHLDKKIVVAKEILDSAIDSALLKVNPLKKEVSKSDKQGLKDIKKHSAEEMIQKKNESTEIESSVRKTDDIEDTLVNSTTDKVNTSYSKQDQIRQKKYYRNKKRDKFAKRMKVELEDSLIGQKKRSFKRLFKFSLSFKLSFVFILLIVLTVVSLSVAFYLGIDYVIELNTLGKLDDIQFFKDVLIVLLIIFDLSAVLICISLGTKASRELVRPIDEMTQIVNQISVKDMNRRLNVKGMHDELKELAMTFNEMLDRIEHSYETQNRFTSDASHELRTPIAVIQGYINMLDRWGKADSEILDESIEAIKSESHNMKRLTEKLLLLAKADKGILEMDFQHFELNDLIKEISRETQMIDTHHEISNEINEVKTILADRESLKQAIRIFVDNSVKYTPEGGKISINSYINKNKIYIEIADNGIGISKEDMANIFNRFYRVDKSRTKDSGGHGLGLSIAKWIISQHKGEIEIKSEVHKGTVVTLILSPIKE